VHFGCGGCDALSDDVLVDSFDLFQRGFTSAGMGTMGLQAAANTRLGFIGAGQMAEAIARGLKNAGVVSADRMFAADISVNRCQVFESFGTCICPSNAKVCLGPIVCVCLFVSCLLVR